MTLRSFIYRHAHVGDIIIFRENGWQIGMTRIDDDDLYLLSLNPKLLDDYEVVNFSYEERVWTTLTVLVVDILPTVEVNRRVRETMVQRGTDK